MTEPARGLDAEIDELSAAIDSLAPRGMAAIFGVCGRALAPLLQQVEQRSEGRFTVPEFGLALDLIEAFATGSADVADYSELKARLDRAVSDDEHPWSTFAQDALICADTGLILAMGGDRPKGLLIQFVLEPLAAVLEDRDADIFRTYGGRYWRREVVKDPAMAMALGFLHRSIATVSPLLSLDAHEFGALVAEAVLLRPAYPD
jgi:hypothetical protein